ncbi:MAG TPA: hypothetical protein VMR90_01830 [Candidatus Cybelea sp.]|nr:hypothetical protein [Candidatus Cybelea sp.]
MLRNPVSKRSVISISVSLMALAVLATMTLSLVPRAAHADERNGELHVTKNCSAWTLDNGAFCTITSSNLPEIEVGSKVLYAQAPVGCDNGGTTYPCTVPLPTPEGAYISVDSSAVLYVGTGNWAVGRCTLDNTGNSGLCTFSDGVGRLSGFRARVDVSSTDGLNYNWNGTYSFNENHR